MSAWGQGAEADATWCVDSHGCEFNCVNFQARLRDWARLGLLVAARGVGKDGQRVVSEAWIDEVTSWGPNDKQVRRTTHGSTRRALQHPPPWTLALQALTR